MNAVGIDVSKKKSTVTIRQPGDIVLLPPRDYRHTQSSINELIATIKGLDGETKVCMEHTGRYYEPMTVTMTTAWAFPLREPYSDTLNFVLACEPPAVSFCSAAFLLSTLHCPLSYAFESSMPNTFTFYTPHNTTRQSSGSAPPAAPAPRECGWCPCSHRNPSVPPRIPSSPHRRGTAPGASSTQQSG